ncbi:secondary thiamine-phosphate synthase enzyme [Methylobacterium indicum]|uniref:Secondary thiamine-phosphate synthase enzyme n=1 Tax=Methylobacterium indicum TaxID=1775910 RepID=A0ABR5GXP6_9HYPH|nr:secondary thiamine-phosphate synthase enzyme YjbQ [Methylobacterium indicum]KMO14942.1 secondary thiamine-phosphate synthase enzyme [Methylobacterium indicum]KMO16242.1 secondary thiamine-phosphate synthase enzyme [Methylobacterium indicum]KTS25359.1 secondary thiamine-phosphate synthase enzyme [Methylobacterium indicum]KTS30649.1 secondary thiamine-phosphate synthase enzyme [Methylobacterium indicum]KTS53607.1 secondary thiamine-phosphate synthase enzyme [Methylobacterium indicum]
MRRVEMLGSGPVTRQASGRLVVETRGQGFTEITSEVAGFVREAGLRQGLLTVFCRHTSASLTIQENADPDVRTDLMSALDRLAPRDVPYVHGIEGPDDMPAHIRTLLTDATLSIPVVEGRLALGTWQGVYLIEHRDRPHRREIVLHLAGS